MNTPTEQGFLHPFLPQQKLFKAYDIRGELTLFTDDFVWALAQNFADLFNTAQQGQSTPTVVIGYDARNQSLQIAKFIAYACQCLGLTVQWLGLTTTPMMAFIAQQSTGNGLIVTASHSQKHINGIKWLVNFESPSQDDILQVFDRLTAYPAMIPDNALLTAIDRQSYPTNTPYIQQYLDAIQSTLISINQTHYFATSQEALPGSSSTHFAYAPKRLVIDCMHGATSVFAQALFTQLGYECVMLNNQADGDFPTGNPDPTELNRLHQLAQTIVSSQSDIGLAFDGDGDRLMLMNRLGQLLSPDNLLYLLARISLEELPQSQQHSQPQIIFDVKCSHHVPSLIASHGAYPMIAKTGSSMMRKSLRNKSNNAIFAGELSGHFIFNDGYFVLHDDAMYAAARLLNWLRFQSQTFDEILQDLPICISTADMYLPLVDADAGQKIITRLMNLGKRPFKRLKNTFAIKNVNTIDGLRLDFADGFGILRKSNTGNFLTVRFCANSNNDLQQIKSVFVNLCRSIDDELAEQVAQIQPI